MTQNRAAPPYGLIAVHFVLAHCPLVNAFVPLNNLSMLPLHWAFSSILFAEMILLAAWVSLSVGGRWRKYGVALGAVAYLMLWPTAAHAIYMGDVEDAWLVYFSNFPFGVAFMTLIVLAFASVRRLIGVVERVEREPRTPGKGVSVSLRAALLVTTVAAIILGFVRVSRGAPNPNAPQMILFFVVYSANAIVTFWACLGPPPIAGRLTIAVLTASLLGVAVSLGSGHADTEQFRWVTFGAPIVVVVLPTAIIVGTLLVVRRRGFRLIPPAASTIR